ncbi:MAG: hypothetical protein GY856_22180, partial [bacterium]|nr:hypothetical protein [bacterium]
MDMHVAHLRCRYQVLGPRPAAESVASRLDGVRDELPAVIEGALDQALGNDPAVYVLRRVKNRVSLRLAAERPDSELAETWGKSLAAAVLHAVHEHAEDAAEVMRFADQGEYVAHFLVDLLAGRAWERWYYHPFAAYKSSQPAGGDFPRFQPAGGDFPRFRRAWADTEVRPYGSGSETDVLHRVLLGNRDHLAGILARLERQGALDGILDRVDETALSELWSEERERLGAPGLEELRALVTMAFSLVDRLGRWAGDRPRIDDFLALYRGTRPEAADWRDRGSLAAAMIDVLRFAVAERRLRPTAPEADFDERLDQALAELDWLDLERLRRGLVEALATAVPDDAAPRPPRGRGATPRQKELLADLGRILGEGELRLDVHRRHSPANALRLYARLVDRFPRWADDSGARALIERLLRAWHALAGLPRAVELLRRLGEAESVSLPPELPATAARDLRFFAGLGPVALRILEALVGPVGRADAGPDVGSGEGRRHGENRGERGVRGDREVRGDHADGRGGEIRGDREVGGERAEGRGGEAREDREDFGDHAEGRGGEVRGDREVGGERVEGRGDEAGGDREDFGERAEGRGGEVRGDREVGWERAEGRGDEAGGDREDFGERAEGRGGEARGDREIRVEREARVEREVRGEREVRRERAEGRGGEAGGDREVGGERDDGVVWEARVEREVGGERAEGGGDEAGGDREDFGDREDRVEREVRGNPDDRRSRDDGRYRDDRYGDDRYGDDRYGDDRRLRDGGRYRDDRTGMNAPCYSTAPAEAGLEVAGEGAVVAAVERLLSIWAWIVRAESPAEVSEAFQRGSPAAVLQQLPEEIRRQAAVDLGFLGEPGLEVVAALLADATQPPAQQRELLTDLNLLLRQGELRLDLRHPASPSNVEQLARALVQEHARWRDLAAGGMSALEQRVERLLASCARLLEIGPEYPARRREQPATPVVVAEAAREGIETGCAGVFLLLRAILDAHLPAIVNKADYPPGAEPSPLGAVLTALGWCWGGEPAVVRGGPDPGLALLAGWTTAPTLDEIRGSWRQATAEDHLRFQTALLRILAGQRLVRGSVLHLHQVARGDRVALVAGVDGRGLWPLGRVFPSREALRSGLGDLLTRWMEIWRETLG